MFTEAIEAILRDRCTPAVVRAVERGDGDQGLWAAIADAGFLDLMKPEADGGAGLALGDVYAIVTLCGYHAVPLPLAPTLLARALVDGGVALPAEPTAFATTLQRDAGGGLVAPRVPDGLLARQVIAGLDGRLLLLDARAAQCTPSGIAGSSTATLSWPAGAQPTELPGDAAALPALTAAAHAALAAGAMRRVFELTLQHCNDRQQFGKPLGKFQAIQHQLSVMAEQVAAVAIAAEAAFASSAHVPARLPALLPAAMAKARAGQATPRVADTAHALHGAIGVTEEYELQLYTRRLHDWRMAHGAETAWNRVVGEQVLAGRGSLAEFVRG
ncbi:MAG: acyl-CoA dehydrogenase family protein [Rubrivivax sp.]